MPIAESRPGCGWLQKAWFTCLFIGLPALRDLAIKHAHTHIETLRLGFPDPFVLKGAQCSQALNFMVFLPLRLLALLLLPFPP